MFSLIRRIREINRIHEDTIKGLFLGSYPTFVYKRLEELSKSEIPIFMFHSVQAKTFEKQIRYLAENNYHSVKADELYDIIFGQKEVHKNVVALTFDDGHKSLWTIAYPILKKYNFSCISFIIPGRMHDDPKYYPNLEDVWHGENTAGDVEDRDSKELFCTWNEVLRMHESGIVDFQSHTTYHHTVFTNNRIVDFMNPHLRASFTCSDLDPVIRKKGRDVVPETSDWGYPIYDWAPAMTVKRRYIEDENLTEQVINFVQINGDESFFKNFCWRKDLKKFVKDFKKKHVIVGRFQTNEERYSEIREDLLQSRLMIEEKLNKRVSHLCYPWCKGSRMSVEASKEAGYSGNYWGIHSRKATNSIGNDCYYLNRISADFIPTLPGKGRIALFEVLRNKYCNRSRVQG